MLEWMHDDSVVHDLQTDFSSKTIEDCKSFIECSMNDKCSLNLAISDDIVYSVSLKELINRQILSRLEVEEYQTGEDFGKEGQKGGRLHRRIPANRRIRRQSLLSKAVTDGLAASERCVVLSLRQQKAHDGGVVQRPFPTFLSVRRYHLFEEDSAVVLDGVHFFPFLPSGEINHVTAN